MNTTPRPETQATTHDVTTYGAVGDGKTLCTQAIQQAIDATQATQGGRVYFPAGTYLTGSVHLHSGVTLDLHPAATILGSPNLEDYSEHGWGQHIDRTPWHLIGAFDCHDITITGGGTINGNGPAFWEPVTNTPGSDEPTPLEEIDVFTASPLHAKDPATARLIPIMAYKDKRPSPMIEITGCSNVRINNIHITNSAGWNLHLHNSEFIYLHGIKLTSSMRGPNNDGFDITGCQDVMVSDCYLSCCDDAIVLKTTPDSRPIERVTVTNCIMRTHCVALKCGTSESFHDFRQITFSNCVVFGSSRAVGLYTTEGAIIEDVTISNIVCDTKLPCILNRPIHLDARRKTPESKLGTIRNVTISNVVCRTDGRIVMTGEAEMPLRNITLRDIQMVFPTVDDVTAYGAEYGGGQYSLTHPDARVAMAVVVAKNIDRLVVDGLNVDWPEIDEKGVMQVPDDWKFPVKNGNGTDHLFPRDVFSPGDQLPAMPVLWGRGLKQGYLKAPMAEPSRPGVERCDLKDCQFTVCDSSTY